MQLNPFKWQPNKKLVKALRSIATENYGNPFGELARIKILAKDTLRNLPQEGANVKKTAQSNK